MTVTTALTPEGAMEYTHQIRLTETAGASATITKVFFYIYAGSSLYATSTDGFQGGEAWSNGNNVIAANGTLNSRELILTDGDPDEYGDRIEAKIDYTDASSSNRSITVSASSPPRPGPPPGSKFTLSGTVRDAGTGSAIRDVRVRVEGGTNVGREGKTDSSGKYTIRDLTTGTFTIRASKTGYNAATQSIPLLANKTANFNLSKSGGGGGGGGGGTSLTCNGASVPSVVDCPNDQGRKAPTARCKDGTYSCSQNRSGTCSSHGGVSCWVCPGVLCQGLTAPAFTIDETPAEPAWLMPRAEPKRLPSLSQ
jgi:hypothetical protein